MNTLITEGSRRSVATEIDSLYWNSLKALLVFALSGVGAGFIWTPRRSWCGQCVGRHVDTLPENIRTV